MIRHVRMEDDADHRLSGSGHLFVAQFAQNGHFWFPQQHRGNVRVVVLQHRLIVIANDNVMGKTCTEEWTVPICNPAILYNQRIHSQRIFTKCEDDANTLKCPKGQYRNR